MAYFIMAKFLKHLNLQICKFNDKNWQKCRNSHLLDVKSIHLTVLTLITKNSYR